MTDQNAKRYFQVKYPNNSRNYCFHYVGDDELVVGSEVKIRSRGADSDDDWVRGTVVEAGVAPPKFQTKGLLGLAPPPEPKQ